MLQSAKTGKVQRHAEAWRRMLQHSAALCSTPQHSLQRAAAGKGRTHDADGNMILFETATKEGIMAASRFRQAAATISPNTKLAHTQSKMERAGG